MQTPQTRSICVPDIYQAVTRDIVIKVNRGLVALLVALQQQGSNRQGSFFASMIAQGIGQLFLLPALLKWAGYLPLFDHGRTAQLVEEYVGKWSGNKEDWGYSEAPVFPSEKNIDYCASMTLICARGTIVVSRDDLRGRYCVYLTKKCKSDYLPIDHGSCGRSCPKRCNQKSCKGGFLPKLPDWEHAETNPEFGNKWYDWQQHFNQVHLLTSPYAFATPVYAQSAPSCRQTADFYQISAKESQNHINMLYHKKNRPIVHKFMSELWLRLQRMYCEPPSDLEVEVEADKCFHWPFDKERVWTYIIAMIRCCIKKK